MPVVTPLPTAGPGVLGLIDLRGEILPVLDAAVLLGYGRCLTPSHLAVVECVRGAAGIVTSGPVVVVELPDTLGPARLRATLGTAWVSGDIEASVVDVEALLALPTARAGAA